MAAIKFSYVYRMGAAAGAPVPDFFLCVNVSEITETLTIGDTAFQTGNCSFVLWNGQSWQPLESADLQTRVLVLEFLVAAIIKKGFGGL